MVGLSELDSNKYKAILRLKRRINEYPDLVPVEIIADGSDSCNRVIDEFGEMAVKRLTQPPRIEFTSDDIATIISSYQTGQSTYEIAREFGCSKYTISTLLKRHGVEVSNRKAQAKLDAQRVISMYEEMHTTGEIAKHFGVSPYTIIRCLKGNGVKIRSRWDYTQK